MKCERCKHNDATIHLSEIVKDVKSEVHLCEHCARDVGLNTRSSNFSLSLPEMLTFLNVDDLSDYGDNRLCAKCGCTFLEYKREGKLGCSDCYLHLEEEIEAVVADYYAEKHYKGKKPLYNDPIPQILPAPAIKVKDKINIDELLAQLEHAVSGENYEEAALLRDRIRDINRLPEGE
jgi:protein arginine kinase activator